MVAKSERAPGAFFPLNTKWREVTNKKAQANIRRRPGKTERERSFDLTQRVISHIIIIPHTFVPIQNRVGHLHHTSVATVLPTTTSSL
jgi:hypothetical protein